MVEDLWAAGGAGLATATILQTNASITVYMSCIYIIYAVYQTENRTSQQIHIHIPPKVSWESKKHCSIKNVQEFETFASTYLDDQTSYDFRSWNFLGV